MGSDGSIFLKVHILFLLAIKEREKQVKMIQQLMEVIQTPALLEELASAQNPGKALQVVREAVS